MTAIFNPGKSQVLATDVLYLSFERPQHATDSVLTQDNVLLRYRGKKLVGITIIGTKASRVKA